ncbi:MAG: hypothetical protein L0170_18725 [Acidobacteria bacterium]|nr:hypothetical protein [Acidobacteriota bacterium]
MMRRLAAIIVLALLAATLSGAAGPPQLVAQWSSPADTGQKFQKILAIGITDDRELRHRFEDNVVTHLRGKDILAVTSYSLVPDLQSPGSREEILQRIEAQKIDAALSFRAVPLEKRGEAAWDAEWMREAEGKGTLRELIQATLPLKATKSKLYGVEVTLWVNGTPARLWSGRSGAYKLDEWREGASGFIQDVIGTLRYSHRI